MKKTQTYEEAITRLEEIVVGLEQGDQPLDASMKLFEEGIGLVDFCSRKLEKAEQKITELSKIPEKAEEKS